MGASRRQYMDEFKQEAVELLASSGRPLSQIAEELGIPAARLRAWRNTTGRGQVGSPRRPNTQAVIPPAGADLAAENARLRRENERLRMECEILKKRCASSRNHQNEIPPHRGSARDVPGSHLVRRHGCLCGRVLCLARPTRKPAQGGQSRLT
jgi:transposase